MLSVLEKPVPNEGEISEALFFFLPVPNFPSIGKSFWPHSTYLFFLRLGSFSGPSLIRPRGGGFMKRWWGITWE